MLEHLRLITQKFFDLHDGFFFFLSLRKTFVIGYLSEKLLEDDEFFLIFEFRFLESLKDSTHQVLAQLLSVSFGIHMQ